MSEPSGAPTLPTADILARSRAQWTTAAAVWDEDGDVIAASTRAVTEALIDAAAPAPGMRVLDVAGGTGDPAVRLVPLVGARGSVICSDLTPAMLAGARRRLAGAANVRFVAASAEALPFATRTQDAVVCRFGAMLFADPARGIREMLRVARPGATVTAVVWGAPERNPYFSAPMGAVTRLAEGLPPPDPDAPGVFRLCACGRLAELFEGAGARAVREQRRAITMDGALGLDDFWPFMLRMAAPLRAAVETQSHEVRGLIAAAVREAVAPYFPRGRMRFPAEIVLVHGVRP